MEQSESIAKLIANLSRLPGIGKKSAQRMAYYIISSEGSYAYDLASSINDAKEHVKYCSVCFNLTDTDPCQICTALNRDKTVICVVQESKDVLAIEATKNYHGLYHVLGGAISPMNGIGPEDLRIRELLSRLNADVHEVILATALNVEGETTAMYLARMIKPLGIKTTRLARGIPTGAELEYTDAATLTTAIEERHEMD